jgi:hypothetical protein
MCQQLESLRKSMNQYYPNDKCVGKRSTQNLIEADGF